MPSQTVAAPRFRAGQAVRVHDRWPDHHVRTPGYVRGRRGVVTGVYGAFPSPEQLAYGAKEPQRVWLYSVEFPQQDVWEPYAGPPTDVVCVDLYEHWLDEEDGP